MRRGHDNTAGESLCTLVLYWSVKTVWFFFVLEIQILPTLENQKHEKSWHWQRNKTKNAENKLNAKKFFYKLLSSTRGKLKLWLRKNLASFTIKNQLHLRFPEVFTYFLRNKAAELKELHSFLLPAKQGCLAYKSQEGSDPSAWHREQEAPNEFCFRATHGQDLKTVREVLNFSFSPSDSKHKYFSSCYKNSDGKNRMHKIGHYISSLTWYYLSLILLCL